MGKRKPWVIVDCVANSYTDHRERIIEFSDQDTPAPDGAVTGGLISFRRTSDGHLNVSVYACSGPIDVIVQDAVPVWVRGRKIAGGRRAARGRR